MIPNSSILGVLCFSLFLIFNILGNISEAALVKESVEEYIDNDSDNGIVHGLTTKLSCHGKLQLRDACYLLLL